MKEDEKKSALKRKINPDVPAEESFSKPKLRKVSKSLSVVLPKSSREEIMKIQTYQQFMKKIRNQKRRNRSKTLKI